MDNEDFVELEEEETELDVPAPEKPKVAQAAFLETSNTARICNRPGGRKFDYSFPRTTIKDVKRSEFLVLGFDTEYQSPQETFELEEIKLHGGEGLQPRGVFLDAEPGEIELRFSDCEDVPAHFGNWLSG